jgi:hypothetical protein
MIDIEERNFILSIVIRTKKMSSIDRREGALV